MVIKIVDKLKPILVDRATRRLAVASLIFNLLTWAFVIVRLFPMLSSGRMIALHYNVYLNVNSVGPAYLALLSPGIGLVILLINVAMAVKAYGPSRQNALVVLSITLFYELLIFIASVFIILINLSR